MLKHKSLQKNIVRISVLLFVIVSLLFFQRLVMPKYMSESPEGAMIAEYYSEEKNHDVIFIGDCEVYDSFVPAVLWENYGINSYVRGSAQQLIWQSYYILEETLRYETPDVVVFNVLALKYNAPQKESYNRMTLDGMKPSVQKWKSVAASMLEEENMIEYIFPLLRFHSRITALTTEDWKYLFNKNIVTHNGYFMRVDVAPATDIPDARPLGEYAFGENAMDYLNRITNLCNENGIKLVLVKAPTLYPHWFEQWEQQVEAYAERNNLAYINFLEIADECNIDYTSDTYDAGLHLNLSGAEKVTMWFGEYLQNEIGLEDHRNEKELNKVWEKKLAAFYEEKEKKTNQWLKQ